MAEFEYEKENLGKVLKQMLAGRMDSSDRTRAIIGGSYVEDALEALLRSRFIQIPPNADNKPTIIDTMFSPIGELSSFRVKITLCYTLGLIGDKTRRDLVIVKDIRNRFAHKMLMPDSHGKFQVVTFAIQQIADWCSNLNPAIIEAGGRLFGDTHKTDLSRRYSIYCAFVTQLIFKRLQQKPVQPFGLIDTLLG